MLSSSKLSFFNVQKHGNNAVSTTSDFLNYPRPYFNIGFIIDGKGNFSVPGSHDTLVSPGDIIIVPSAAQYISHMTGTPTISYITFHFIFEDENSVFNAKNIPIQKISGLSVLREKFECSLENFGKDISKQFKVMSEFYEILHIITPKLKFSPSKHKNTSVKKAIDFITINYKSEITVAELAAVANLSQSRFFTVFKSETGMTPIEYKNRICIRNAEKMLICEDFSIEELSEKLGFNSSSYFRRTFKMYTGKSPREYKNSIKSNM